MAKTKVKRSRATDRKPATLKSPARQNLQEKSQAIDFFKNFAARMGYGTPSLAEDTEYVMERLSLNYWLMLTLYRNHWIARRVVDLPAEDMTRNWCRLNCELSPEDISRFDRVVDRTFVPARIEQTLKWARLYGGAAALMVIDGHEDHLEDPLDLDDIAPGSFKGLITFDRWQGIIPWGEVSNDFSRPQDFGLPEFYQVRGQTSSQSFNIHASRILRFLGPEVPIPELQAMSWWGISVLEVIYEELRKRDNASWSILQLLFRAQILAQKNPELAMFLSGVGANSDATQGFYQRMDAQNKLLSNQSMMVLGEDGELFSTQFAFSGLAEVYALFEMAVAGASEIPMTRLYGRTMTGLGQSNDADERYYEERIAHEQSSRLKPQISKLYPVICMSVFGEVPDDLDMLFPSIRVLTEEEKGDMADKGSAPILASFNAGVTGRKTTLKELKQLADSTGIFSNITDEQIEQAQEEPELPGEMSEGEESGEVGGPPGSHAHANPRRELKQESGGAMDSKDPYSNHDGEQ